MHRIAVIAGDGVGKEVVPEGIKVMEAALPGLDFELFGWGSDFFAKTGRMMPEDALGSRHIADVHPRFTDHLSGSSTTVPSPHIHPDRTRLPIPRASTASRASRSARRLKDAGTTLRVARSTSATRPPR
jgi:hypothetical protein